MGRKGGKGEGKGGLVPSYDFLHAGAVKQPCTH